MSRARVRTEMVGTVRGAEALWYDLRRWPAFVDGFGHLAKQDEEWPRAGARIVWDSRPGGRGRVVEQVAEYREGEGQRSDVEDERLTGTQEVTFEEASDGVVVTLGLDYRLKQRGPLRIVTDALFIRRAIADSLRRTLAPLRARAGLGSRAAPVASARRDQATQRNPCSSSKPPSSAPARWAGRSPR